MQKFEYLRPDRYALLVMGVLFIGAACVGVVMVGVLARGFDLKTVVLMIFGFIGGCALGVAFINSGRRPLLTIRPDGFSVPTFLGTRDIAIQPGHPLGEFLGTSKTRARRAGGPQNNLYAHFYTLDADGALAGLLVLHRDALDLPKIRHAFNDIAGLQIETLKRDPTTRSSRPDISHWKNR